jgi:peptidoglycan-associated lipoprotein
MNKHKISAIVLGLSLMAFMAGCKGHHPPTAPPAPPSTAPAEAPRQPGTEKPVITEFSAEPSTIEHGGSATLKWATSNASEASIDQGIGSVSTHGSRTIYPTNTTTYTLTVKGLGGSAEQTATVNVTTPPSPEKAAVAPSTTLSDRLSNDVKDAFFDYDKAGIREDARAALTKDADALKSIFNDFADAAVMVEGHCDERGSEEYNLALGDRRATAAKEFLVQLGVSADKLKTISYGKDRPQCTEHDEACWQSNRRAHFSAGQ